MLWCLPITRATVFTIKTDLADLERVSCVPGFAAPLAGRWRAVSDPVAVREGLLAIRASL